MTIEIDQRYTGVNCPHCNSHDISARDEDDLDARQKSQNVSCRACGAEWVEFFYLTHWDSLEFRKTFRIPRDRVDQLNDILSGRIDHKVRDGEVIDKLVLDLLGGHEIDIKVVAGDSAPYVDAVLFRDGIEVCTCEPGESVEGEYVFYTDRATYEIIVEPDSEPTEQN
jgi:DNA-directed RNA polymerase subunit RPC12/RpoP